MAWNEPGGNKDPWSRKPPKGNSEIEKLISEFSKSFKDLLGGSGSGSSSGSNKKNTSIFIGVIVLVYLLMVLRARVLQNSIKFGLILERHVFLFLYLKVKITYH